jgi:hypothetical protein
MALPRGSGTALWGLTWPERNESHVRKRGPAVRNGRRGRASRGRAWLGGILPDWRREMILESNGNNSGKGKKREQSLFDQLSTVTQPRDRLTCARSGGKFFYRLRARLSAIVACDANGALLGQHARLSSICLDFAGAGLIS